jgi:hypothetical protein
MPAARKIDAKVPGRTSSCRGTITVREPRRSLQWASLGTDDVEAVLLKGAHDTGTGDDRQPLGAHAESRTSTGATIGSGASGTG